MTQGPADLVEHSVAQPAVPLATRSLVFRWLFPVLTLGAVGSAIFFVLSGVPGAISTTTPDGAPAIPRAGAPAPDFRAMTLEGKPVSLRDYRGKVVLVNFWATWCGPCRDELPALSEAYRERKDEGFAVLAVDVREEEGDVRRFLQDIPVPFPVLLDGDGAIYNRYAVVALPTSFFVDEDGVIRAVVVGNMNRDAVIKRLGQMADNRAADQAAVSRTQ